MPGSSPPSPPGPPSRFAQCTAGVPTPTHYGPTQRQTCTCAPHLLPRLLLARRRLVKNVQQVVVLLAPLLGHLFYCDFAGMTAASGSPRAPSLAFATNEYFANFGCTGLTPGARTKEAARALSLSLEHRTPGATPTRTDSNGGRATYTTTTTAAARSPCTTSACATANTCLAPVHTGSCLAIAVVTAEIVVCRRRVNTRCRGSMSKRAPPSCAVALAPAPPRAWDCAAPGIAAPATARRRGHMRRAPRGRRRARTAVARGTLEARRALRGAAPCTRATASVTRAGPCTRAQRGAGAALARRTPASVRPAVPVPVCRALRRARPRVRSLRACAHGVA